MFLTTLSQLEQHSLTLDRTKLARRLAIELPAARQRPSAQLVEQPGYWLYPSYRVRAALLDVIAEHGFLSRGICMLDSDGFSSFGAKRSLSFVDFAHTLPSVSLLGHTCRDRFEHQASAEAILDTDDAGRIQYVARTITQLLNAAGLSEARMAFTTAQHPMRQRPRQTAFGPLSAIGRKPQRTALPKACQPHIKPPERP
ncbi:MAG: hypothetical protein JNN30_03670 [Rhodanobacteraceae bacterium]|nr:hypothetical protein [Rhodanobacteraceae bacterium]